MCALAKGLCVYVLHNRTIKNPINTKILVGLHRKEKERVIHIEPKVAKFRGVS